jgi:hypothetical protein
MGGPNAPVTALSLQDGYRVTPWNLPAGYTLESLTFGSIDLLREPIRFTNDTSTAIRLSLRGTPLNQDGRSSG